MSKFLLIAVALATLIALCTAEPVVYHRRIIFPGPEHYTQKFRFPARQEAAPKPYPDAGFKPKPGFELPSEEETFFLEPTQEKKPDEIYGPPQQTYEPPEEVYVAPPEQAYGPPDATELTDPNEFFPKTELSLPIAERLTVFRREPERQPLAGVAAVHRPIQTPAKFTRRDPRPRPVARPAKLKAVLHHAQRQESFAQLQPINKHQISLADGTVIYSDRPQSW